MKNIFLSLLILLSVFHIELAYAEENTHKHGDRIHSHALPHEGFDHNHNGGLYGKEVKKSEESTSSDGYNTAKSIYTHNKKTFYISPNTYLENKGLIILILNTESMDDDERQYWFDIMPSMTKEQIDRLYKILETEKIKLAELEVKYIKEIRSLNEKHLSEWEDFQIKKTLEAKKKEGYDFSNFYFLTDNLTGRPSIQLSKSSSTDEIIKKILTPKSLEKRISENKIGRTEELITLDYIKEIIINIEVYKEIYDKELLDSFFNIASSLAAKHVDLEALSLLQPHVGVTGEEVDIFRGNYTSIAKRYQGYLDNLNDKQWQSNIISKLYKLTIWRSKDSCKDYCKEVISNYFKKMEESNFPFSIDNIRDDLYLDYIWLDYVLFFNQDIIQSSFELKMKNFIEENYKNHTKKPSEQDSWYYLLTKSFFEGTISKIYLEKSQSYISENDKNTFDTIKKSLALEGDVMESGTYLAFFLIKQNKISDAVSLLNQLTRLGNSYQSSAYRYMEKDLINHMVSEFSRGKPNRIKGPRDIGILVKNGGTPKSYGKKYALIVGISDYAELSRPSRLNESSGQNLYDLQYAHKDAQEFKKFILDPKKSGGNWIIREFVNSNAKKLEIRKSIDSIIATALPEDLIYIFFSGHARTSSYNNNEIYLLTHDFKVNDPYSGIPYDWFLNKISKARAKHVVVFIDACRSGVVDGSKGEGAFNQELLAKVSKFTPSKIIFTSGTSSQISYEDDSLENGVFTHFLLKGINGSAKDENNDGYVNINELERYTHNEVAKFTMNSGTMTAQEPRIHTFDSQYSTLIPISLR